MDNNGGAGEGGREQSYDEDLTALVEEYRSLTEERTESK